MAQRKFAHCLGEFQFEYIGDAKTDDEKCIGKCGFFNSVIHHHGNSHLKSFVSAYLITRKARVSFVCTWLCRGFVSVCEWEWQIGFLCLVLLSDESLQEFSLFLKNLEDQRELMVRTASPNLPPNTLENTFECAWACFFDLPSVSVSEWGSACRAYTCKLHLHLSFINAWLPFARDP